MARSIERDEIQDIIARHLSPTNRNPYDRESFHGGMDPHMIYLYCWDHVDTAQNAQQKARAFKLDHDNAIYNRQVLVDRINERAQQIFDGRRPDGEYFESFDWERKSFIVILLTDPNWHFAEGKSIVFDESKGLGNHTFFNAFHPKVRVRTGGAELEIPALCFSNWMVDSYGRYLHDGQLEEFHYILLTIRNTNRERALMAEIDPGGNNLGPPIPP